MGLILISFLIIYSQFIKNHICKASKLHGNCTQFISLEGHLDIVTGTVEISITEQIAIGEVSAVQIVSYGVLRLVIFLRKRGTTLHWFRQSNTGRSIQS